jgi:hypothetical protein
MWQLVLGALGVYATIWCRWRLETSRLAPPLSKPRTWEARRRGGDAGSRTAYRRGEPPRRWQVLLYWLCLTACAALVAHGLAALVAG